MAHLAIIIIGGLIGVALLVGSAFINPIESLSSLPVWSWPIAAFMFFGGFFSSKEP